MKSKTSLVHCQQSMCFRCLHNFTFTTQGSYSAQSLWSPCSHQSSARVTNCNTLVMDCKPGNFCGYQEPTSIETSRCTERNRIYTNWYINLKLDCHFLYYYFHVFLLFFSSCYLSGLLSQTTSTHEDTVLSTIKTKVVLIVNCGLNFKVVSILRWSSF